MGVTTVTPTAFQLELEKVPWSSGTAHSEPKGPGWLIIKTTEIIEECSLSSREKCADNGVRGAVRADAAGTPQCLPSALRSHDNVKDPRFKDKVEGTHCFQPQRCHFHTHRLYFYTMSVSEVITATLLIHYKIIDFSLPDNLPLYVSSYKKPQQMQTQGPKISCSFWCHFPANVRS